MRAACGKTLAVAAMVCFASLSVAAAQTVHIEDIRVQLFYENTGLLSDDFTKKKNLDLWNTTIGEGGSGGPARSFLASIVLRSKPNSFLKQEVVVTVMDDRKKVKLMERRFNGLLFDKEGQLVKPVFVENRTCSPTTISAGINKSTKQVALPFECGE